MQACVWVINAVFTWTQRHYRSRKLKSVRVYGDLSETGPPTPRTTGRDPQASAGQPAQGHTPSEVQEASDMRTVTAHLQLAALEILAGTVIFLLLMIVFGGPVPRATSASAATAALLSATLQGIALPYQWAPSRKEAGGRAAVGSYAWLAPLQLLLHLPTDMEYHRVLSRDVMLMSAVALVMSSSFVYPMDWGMEEQIWPVPTARAVAAALGMSQVAEVMSGAI